MSLNSAEQAATSKELQHNLELTGLSPQDIAADLGWTLTRLDGALGVGGGQDPVDVWQLRDYLEQVLADQGRAGVPFSILTEANRAKARGWFALRTAPRHAFS